jgi:hypothetical protein
LYAPNDAYTVSLKNISLKISLGPWEEKGASKQLYKGNSWKQTRPSPIRLLAGPNRSTEDTIAIALHTALTNLDKRNAYVRILFIDYSSAFNTIVPIGSPQRIEFLPMQLGPGLSDGPSPGGEGR